MEIEIVNVHVANQGVPTAQLVSLHPKKSRLKSLGRDQGCFVVPVEFNDPLPRDMLTAFEGGEE